MQQINKIVDFFSNMTTEQIIGIVFAIVMFGIFWLFSSVFAKVIIKILKINTNKKEIKQNAFYKPLKLLFIIIGMYLAAITLKLPENIMAIFYKIFKISIILIISKGLANIFDSNSRIMKKIAENEKVSGNKTLSNYIGKIAKTIVYIFAAYLIITELGYDLTGLMAGLGLGGVIVALAAQDVAKNLFGGMAIILDKPFSVGDWIQAGTYEGTVENITFRSTRIRTVEDIIVNIQNSTLANESIVNFAKMDKRRYSFNLKLPLNTNSDSMETIITRIKFILENNKDVMEKGIVVECNSILNDGINIFVAMYTNIIVYSDYLAFRTKINKDILNIIEAEGIRLSYPTQDIHVI